MLVPLVLLTFLTVISKATCDEAPTSQETVELGKALNLRGTNLLSDFQERERSIFESLPSNCFRKDTRNLKSSRFFEYYESNKAFYSSLGTESSLDASVQSSYTLGATLNVATKSKSSETNKVSGMSLNVIAIKEKILVRRGCLGGDETKFKKQFLRKLELLPVKIEKPWQKHSWKPYRNFITEYGSHVVTSVSRGTSFKQMTFAESSKSYSERDFQVKSCISFAGPTSVGKVGVEACANISKSEIRRASEMSTSDKVFVLGGDPKTRNKLLHKDTRSNELIEQLMNEAGGDSASSVQHTFRAIWDILTSRFDAGSPNHIRAINLENYYLGFLSFGCHSIKGGRVQIQKFDYSSSSTPESPEFECSLAKEGCHSDDDCRYVVGPWCTCRGESCVRYKSVKRDTGDSKKTAYAHRQGNWDWKGCGWKTWTAWTQCSCYNKNRDTREVVWSLPSKDAAASAAPSNGTHHEEKNAGHSEAKEKKKEINLPRTVIL
ncbi:hypothetical protein ACROYT_G006116 [Oculina patagonica]